MDLRKYVLTKKMHLRPATYLNPTDSEFTAEAFPHQNSSVWPTNARSSNAPPKTSPPTEETTPAPQPFLALPDFFTNVPRSRSLTEHKHWFLTHVRNCKNHVSDRNDYEGIYMWGWVVALELAFHQAEQADELSDFLFDVNPKLAHYSEKSLFVPPLPVGKTWIDVLAAGGRPNELGKGKGRAQDQSSSLEDCLFRRVHHLKLRWLNPDWTLGRKPTFTARPPVSGLRGTAVDTDLPRYNPATSAPSNSIPTSVKYVIPYKARPRLSRPCKAL
ncbi:hypothetical protein BDZ89DRAFT_1155986 [Hymenopellis radicata]|nr:hypothetical protein BDZ89DRAFT_1155986 [Hymenopellis radicata]